MPWRARSKASLIQSADQMTQLLGPKTCVIAGSSRGGPVWGFGKLSP